MYPNLMISASDLPVPISSKNRMKLTYVPRSPNLLSLNRKHELISLAASCLGQEAGSFDLETKTNLIDISYLLNALGIPIQQSDDVTQDDIAQALERGNKTILFHSTVY